MASSASRGANQPRLTHQLFRYPAKFHPPIARGLVERYSDPGSLVLDPFCGSGTLLIEAVLAGREAIGSDVDPLAVFVSAVKSRPLEPQRLRRTCDAVFARIETHDRGSRAYERLQWKDIAPSSLTRACRDLDVPPIPNLLHWFRRYVVIDLAHIRDAVEAIALPAHRDFFRLCFASIIRNASNADPVPVSGLEVTSHMLKRDAEGRVVDPFTLFRRACVRAIDDMAQYYDLSRGKPRARAIPADATRISRVMRRDANAVITSPPYHGAVDYYRRHTLEMYWLRLTESRDERLVLLDRYIGRTRVRNGHPWISQTAAMNGRWHSLMRRMDSVSSERAIAFRHYCGAMHLVFEQLGRVLPSGRPAVLVIGHSTWNGARINTSDLFGELAGEWFTIRETSSYRVRNRYMSYARHNGANIDREFVLALERR